MTTTFSPLVISPTPLDYKSPTPKAPPGAMCWICLEEEEEEGSSGESLLRNCACRGTAGFVHISCLTTYNQRKAKESLEDGAEPQKDADGKVIGPPWEVCPNCLQDYTGRYAIDVAEAYANSMKDLPEHDAARTVAELNLARKIQYEDGQRAEEIFKRVLRAIRSSPSYPIGNPSILPDPYLFRAEIACLQGLANVQVCNDFGDIRVARAYLNKARERVLEYYPPSDFLVRDMEACITSLLTDTSIGSIDPHAGRRDFLRENIEIDFAAEEDAAEALADGGKFAEAAKLMRSLIEKSRRILGAGHHATKCAETKLEMLYVIHSKAQSAELVADRQKVCIVPPIDDADDKYICIRPDERGCPSSAKASLSDLILHSGTPIICQDITGAKDRHINGKLRTIKSFHANKGKYMVKVDRHCYKVKPENMRIVFE